MVTLAALTLTCSHLMCLSGGFVLTAAVSVIGETEVVRDGLKHIEPDGTLLALEVTRLKPDAIE